MALTSRGRALVATAVGAWLLSRMLGVDELAMGALAIGALVVLAVTHTALASARLQVRRRMQRRRMFPDDELTVEVELHNDGSLPTSAVHVRDRVPDQLGRVTGFVLAPLSAGESVSLRYHLIAQQRGVYTLGPMHVWLPDPFGIAARRHELAPTDEVTVYPRIWSLPAGLPLSGRRSPEGDGRTRPHTSGEELGTVREYVRGDDLRKVHWRTTAHRGKLMIRQDEAIQEPEVVVVLDRRAEAHGGQAPSPSFETAVEAAASATYHLARLDYRVRLLHEPTSSLPPPVDWPEALYRLAAVSPSPGLDLEALWRRLGRGTGARGTLLAVTALPDRAQLRSMVRVGRGFGVRVAVLVGSGGSGGHPGGRGQRDGVASALRGAGWRVATVAPGDRLDRPWARLIANQPRGTAARRHTRPARAP